MAQRKSAPLVGVVMGSDSDWEIMKNATGQLEAFGIPYEARVISAQVGGVIVVNAYVVNGQEVGHPRYDYKRGWLGRLRDFVAKRADLAQEKIVVAGDFNVTFDDRDVHDPAAWREQVLCSTPEREALRHIMAPGFGDAFRQFHPEGGHYTWWDFRTRAFSGDRGLRIDHFLMSPPALAACRAVEIDQIGRASCRERV